MHIVHHVSHHVKVMDETIDLTLESEYVSLRVETELAFCCRDDANDDSHDGRNAKRW